MSGLTDEERRDIATTAPSIVLQRRAYLRATVVGPSTCQVCRRDVPSPGLCWQCQGHRQQYPGELADRLGFMTYGVGSAKTVKQSRLRQSGWLMRSYKSGAADADLTAVQMLAYLGLAHHQTCLQRVSGTVAMLWATVPSRRENPGPHPLNKIAVRLTQRPENQVRLEATRPSRERTVKPDHFRAPDGVPEGAHVLLLEDTWTSGASVQSAALTLKRAGAAQVSALVLARWMDPDDAGTRRLLGTVVDTEYTLDFCPWTGNACP